MVAKSLQSVLTLVACLSVAVGCSSQEKPAPSPERVSVTEPISGLFVLSDGGLLLAHDVKPASRKPSLSLWGNSNLAQAKSVSEFSRMLVPPLNDIETVARVPGSEGRVLLAESGGYGGSRRLFLIDLSLASTLGPQLVGSPVDMKGITSKLDNVEAIVVEESADFGQVLKVLLLDRGKLEADSSIKIEYCRVQVDMRRGTAHAIGHCASFTFAVPGEPGQDLKLIRGCTDACLLPSGVLVASAAYDPGDSGPFTSWVYSVELNVNGSLGPATLMFKVPGEKVEAIGVEQSTSQMVLGSDNEALGGSILRVRLTR